MPGRKPCPIQVHHQTSSKGSVKTGSLASTTTWLYLPWTHWEGRGGKLYDVRGCCGRCTWMSGNFLSSPNPVPFHAVENTVSTFALYSCFCCIPATSVPTKPHPLHVCKHSFSIWSILSHPLQDQRQTPKKPPNRQWHPESLLSVYRKPMSQVLGSNWAFFSF